MANTRALDAAPLQMRRQCTRSRRQPDLCDDPSDATMHRFRTPSSALCDMSDPITDVALSQHPFTLHREGPHALVVHAAGLAPLHPGLNAV